MIFDRNGERLRTHPEIPSAGIPPIGCLSQLLALSAAFSLFLVLVLVVSLFFR